MDEDAFFGDYVANLDQMQENVIEVGNVTKSYFNHLQSIGFSRKEAFSLVSSWHGSFWEGAHVPPLDFGGFDEFHDGLEE